MTSTFDRERPNIDVFKVQSFSAMMALFRLKSKVRSQIKWHRIISDSSAKSHHSSLRAFLA